MNAVTLYNDLRVSFTKTLEEWLEIALMPVEDVKAQYGMDNLEIMYQLEDWGVVENYEDWSEPDYFAMLMQRDD